MNELVLIATHVTPHPSSDMGLASIRAVSRVICVVIADSQSIQVVCTIRPIKQTAAPFDLQTSRSVWGLTKLMPTARAHMASTTCAWRMPKLSGCPVGVARHRTTPLRTIGPLYWAPRNRGLLTVVILICACCETAVRVHMYIRCLLRTSA